MAFQNPHVTTGGTIASDKQIFNLDWLSVNSGSRLLGYPYIATDGSIAYDPLITAAQLADFSGAPTSYIQDRSEALAILASDIWGHIAHKYNQPDPTFFTIVSGSFLNKIVSG